MNMTLAMLAVSFAVIFSLSCSHSPAESPSAHAAPAASKGEAQSAALTAFEAEQPAGAKAICPVMKHQFEIKADTPKSFYNGKWYYFCCTGCKPQFDADPAKFAGK
jgi:YHS domain-containing protein